MKTIFALFCLILLLFPNLQPIIIAQTESDAASAMLDARNDATTDVSGTGALAWGFFCGLLGVAVVYGQTPVVPAERLIGKSPEYVRFYSDEYRRVAKSKKTKTAWAGCIMSGCVFLLLSASGS